MEIDYVNELDISIDKLQFEDKYSFDDVKVYTQNGMDSFRIIVTENNYYIKNYIEKYFLLFAFQIFIAGLIGLSNIILMQVISALLHVTSLLTPYLILSIYFKRRYYSKNGKPVLLSDRIYLLGSSESEIYFQLLPETVVFDDCTYIYRLYRSKNKTYRLEDYTSLKIQETISNDHYAEMTRKFDFAEHVVLNSQKSIYPIFEKTDRIDKQFVILNRIVKKNPNFLPPKRDEFIHILSDNTVLVDTNLLS